MSFGKRHLAAVHDLPCACCGAIGVHAHHILEGRIPGRKAPDALAIPLCPDCHTGTGGIHGTRNRMRIYKKTELGMLAWTIEALYG